VNLDAVLFEHPLSDGLAAAQELHFLQALRKNYQQRGERPFCTVEEFLQPGHLDAFTSVSSSEYLTSKHVAQATQRQIAEPLMRVIYDQGLEAHAFATLVAFTSVVGAGSVTEGNSLLVEALLNSSRAQVSTQTTVRKVTRDPAGGFFVDTEKEGIVARSHTDKVVLASPIEFLDIEFVNLTLAPVQPRKFEHWFVTVVQAAGVNPVYFGQAPGTVLAQNILTNRDATAAGTPFNVLQLDAILGPGRNVYKLFSNTELGEVVPMLFLNVTRVFTQVWPYTFPQLKPLNSTGSYQPIMLSEGILYLNTMESVASAMEGSVIAGRNVAQLLRLDPVSSCNLPPALG